MPTFLLIVTNNGNEPGIEGLRKECRVVLDYRPQPGTYKRFNACSQFNRYPEVPCLDATRVVLQRSEASDNDYIHANRVKLEKEQCAGVVMLCNFYEDGTQSCEEFWPTDSGSYKYYGKMFVNNKRIDHLDQYDVYTLEVLPDGCSNSILTRLAHCTTWPEKPGSVAVMCSAGVGRTGTFVAIDAVCTRLFKGFDGKAKMPKYHSKVSRFYAELSKV
ncbi:Protein-tyrosine phosphatase [Ancylostoma ceylanicum]|uniref:Protein-tyrosine phosphatase n=1 Tax=Ancylostoma ceylanicum TaxID=53326 RepID=A0A0D6LLW4_9BILA|nr:Protein-tyrosine phosphatase [Ancylostoma ceylanicum]